MIVDAIKPVGKAKMKVCLDSGADFYLYKKEIKQYNICIGVDISGVYDEILTQILIPRAKRVARESGDFNQEKGRQTMAKIIGEIGADTIDVVFAENDDMAWGAIDSLKAAGKNPGKDVIIVSFDAVKESFNRILKGEINCTCECNPLHGPRVDEIIKTLERGEPVDRIQYVSEGVFDEENAAAALPTRAY